MVHQHFMLVQKHTVAENVALADERAPFLFPAARVAGKLAEFSRRYGLTVDPARRVWQLSAGEQQKVEIVKALLQGADLLILDEPTSVLTPAEAAELFAVVRRMCAEGHSVIFISHKLEEVLSVCTRIVVLRRGAVAGEADPRAVDRASLAGMMVGREVLFSLERGRGRPRRGGARGRRPVRARRPGARGRLGRLVHRAAGRDPRHRGRVGQRPARAGRGHHRPAPLDARRRAPRRAGTSPTCRPAWSGDLGISHVPEERIRFGIVPNLLVFENAVLKQHRNRLFSRSMFLDERAMRGRAADIVASHQVAAPSIEVPVKHLSGGNIQKLILGREIADEHALLVASHPTYGLDVGATEYVRRQLLALRERGKAVLLVSEDLEEIFELADRIAVMYGGRLVGIVDRERADLEEIGLWMAGSARDLFQGAEAAPEAPRA